MTEGNEVKVSFDLESREYNGKWYTDVKAWKVDRLQKNDKEITPENMGRDQEFVPYESLNSEDLPF